MLKRVVLIPILVLGATGAAQAIGGSYRNTCENIQQRGPYLSAECQTVDGDYRRSAIDVRGCNGGVSNSNGRLTCGRGGGYERRGPGYDDRFAEPPRHYFRAPDTYQNDDDN